MNSTPIQISTPEILTRYSTILKNASKLDFLVRDNDLQKNSIEEMKEFLKYIKSFKIQAASRNDEDACDIFFHCQCVLNATICSLSMWLELKRRKYQTAWNRLVEAQEYIFYALRRKGESIGVEEFQEKLKNTETTIFPGFPRYQSAGLIVEGGVCSVCGEPLEACPHIEEEIFLGTVCRRVGVKILEVNHVATVEVPRDRRCIPTEFEFEPGKIFDYITLRYLRDKGSGPNSEGKHMRAVLYAMGDLDLF